MNPSGDAVGNDAGWHLHFYSDSGDTLSVGAGDYYASIEATLPAGLDGGSYRFAIEGITNADYKKLNDVYGNKPLYADLYLYWRDTKGPLGYLASVAGLSDTLDSMAGVPGDEARVARLLVTRLSRRVGARRYEAHIEASERVFEALRKKPDQTPQAATDPRGAAVAVAQKLLQQLPNSPSYKDALAPVPPSDGKQRPPSEVRAYKTGLEALAAFEQGMIEQAQKGGRGMYLIRDGVLHIGLRKIPLDEGPAKPLDEGTGLAHVETAGVSSNQGSGDESGSDSARVQYSLTLKGRPDIKPGDKVTFADPVHGADGLSLLDATTIPSTFGEALAGIGGSILGDASSQMGAGIEVYVSGVSHRLSRTDGFVTTVTGLQAAAGQEWDTVDGKSGTGGGDDPAATPHAEAANAIQRLARAAGGEQPIIGEVRAANLTGSSEPPGQTVDVWLGTVGSDGAPARARRLDIDRTAKSRATGLPYLTPFAWGKSGLVLPRYPGTRVLVGHVGGRSDDAIDLGSVWESGQGPDSQPGDFWLILPAAVPAAKRQSVPDSDTPQPPSQKATNDLIDADGVRTIEVGKLVVRVMPATLGAPGTRPAAPADSAAQVTIEHADKGSRIVIKDDGDIVIESGKDLTLSAKGTVKVSAKDVKVTVSGTMDVSS